MKSMVQIAYGPPEEVLVLKNLSKPSPGSNDLLIRIHAAKVGPSDCAFRKGDPFMIKLLYGLFKPRYAIGGTELSGVIEAVGENVQHFKVGDRILGMSAKNFGAYAEYTCLPEESPLALIPEALSVFDAVGKSSFSKCKHVLTSKGVYLTTALKLPIMLQMMWTSLIKRKRVIFATAGLMQNKANLAFLMELAKIGSLKAVIDRRYTLDQLPAAQRYVETERKKGNVIINIYIKQSHLLIEMAYFLVISFTYGKVHRNINRTKSKAPAVAHARAQTTA